LVMTCRAVSAMATIAKVSECCEGIIEQRTYRIGNISAADFVLGTLPYMAAHRPMIEMGTLVQNVVMMMATLMQRVTFVCVQNLLLSLLTVVAI